MAEETAAAPPPLYYTFGNHMHWVDMQWLWGYEVLPGSTADMLRLCEEAGVRGNVNFDAVGYEKMAAESPAALAALREAVAKGIIEPVGCSYGQPYGQFQGGESNVRQLTFGVRTTLRLLGVRPRTFWEEEFYFFPQLPQLLRGSGFTGACLFFQWTWHTPELPMETHSLIEWEGIDGSRLPALPRNDLNLHQWPEDFDGLLRSPAIHSRTAESGPPAIVQWLELMPSRDWMCRSELLLPRLRQLTDGGAPFQLRPRTAGGLIMELQRMAGEEGRPVPVRSYGPDDVWHGMTLGKNADAHPRASRAAERAILAAESISALAGLFGRPYASWDVYPTWELDEAWRQTLAAQHHDNHECEGLCGFVGHGQFVLAMRMAREVEARAQWFLAHRAAGRRRTRSAAFNSLGWPRTIARRSRLGDGVLVPPFGYATGVGKLRGRGAGGRARAAKGKITLSRGRFSVEIDEKRCAITQMRTADHPDGLLGAEAALLGLSLRQGQKDVVFDRQRVVVGERDLPPRRAPAVIDWSEGQSRVVIRRRIGPLRLKVSVDLACDVDGVDVSVHWRDSPFPRQVLKPDPGLNAALKVHFAPGEAFAVRADSPYSVSQVRGSGACRRKYPGGDWMTSPQWFETVQDPFTAASFVDLCGPDGQGLLVAHDGAQQWFRDGSSVSAVITAYDPWDEARYTDRFGFGGRFRIIPHGPTTDAERVRLAAEFNDGLNWWPATPYSAYDDLSVPVGGGTAAGVDRDCPEAFGSLSVEGAPGVLAHAFHRESMKSGEHLPDWAGHRMRDDSGGACTHAYVVRLVEWNGEPAEVTLKLPGPVALAAKTNLLGEVGAHVGGGGDTAWLDVEPAAPPEWARKAMLKGEAIAWSQVSFRMRPREIATIMADIVPARKQFRDLDAQRKVWATIHKQ